MAMTSETERVPEPCAWPTKETLAENLREVRRAATTARYAAEDAVGEAALNIRRHPFRAVATAAVIAGIAGVLIGFGSWWFARRRT